MGDPLERLEEKVEGHLEVYQQHIVDATQREVALLKATEDNAIAIAATNIAIVALTTSTQGLVDAWSAAAQFQKFIKWAGSLVLVGGFFTWLAKELL